MAHIHKDIDFVANAFIVHKDRVLLIHHKGMGRWLAIGGHIELTEDPEAALFREIEEESGLKKKDLKIFAQKPSPRYPGFDFLYPPTFLDIHDIKTGHRHVAFVYIFSSKTGKVTLKDDEHYDIRWFSKKDLEDKKYNFWPAVKYYCLKAFRITS